MRRTRVFLRPCGSFSVIRPVTVTTAAGSSGCCHDLAISSSRSPGAIEVGVPFTSTPPRAISWGWAGGSAAPGAAALGGPAVGDALVRLSRAGPGTLAGWVKVVAVMVSKVWESRPGAAFDATASPAGMTSGAELEAITARRAVAPMPGRGR